jgi:VanZ family protein
LLQNIRTQKNFVYAALVFYWLILLAATSLPTESLPDVGGGDKIKHFSAYLVLTVLVTLTLMVQEKSSFLRKYAFWAAILISAVYGIADEIHQMFIPGRSCEFLDWVADLGGAVTGAFFVYLIYYFEKISRKG